MSIKIEYSSTIGYLWDLEFGHKIATYRIGDYDKWVKRGSFSDDMTKIILLTEDNTLSVWNRAPTLKEFLKLNSTSDLETVLKGNLITLVSY